MVTILKHTLQARRDIRPIMASHNTLCCLLGHKVEYNSVSTDLTYSATKASVDIMKDNALSSPTESANLIQIRHLTLNVAKVRLD